MRSTPAVGVDGAQRQASEYVTPSGIADNELEKLC
jgi:hypothetical protein